jgi:hypothetical protein
MFRESRAASRLGSQQPRSERALKTILAVNARSDTLRAEAARGPVVVSRRIPVGAHLDTTTKLTGH